MKKNIGKILAMAIVAIMMMSTIAFADAAMGDPAVADNKTVTVTLSGLTANEEATILVVKDGVTLDTVTDADIVYIDQLTVGEDNSVTFTLDASAAVPAEPTADVYVDIFCGYTNMADANPLEGTAKIFTYVAEPEPDVPTPTAICGDIDGNEDVNNRDKTYLTRYLVGGYDIEVSLEAGDIYADGEVNNRDKTYLTRYLVGGYGIDALPVLP